MKQLCDIYGKRFFGKRHKLHWRAPHVCKAIDDVLHPTSVVDVGCATGDLVDCWQHNFGVEAMGIEGDKSAEEFLVTDNIWFYDMRVSNEYSFTFDLCTCLEVAEHIEPEYASIFVKNLVDLLSIFFLEVSQIPIKGSYAIFLSPWFPALFDVINNKWLVCVPK